MVTWCSQGHRTSKFEMSEFKAHTLLGFSDRGMHGPDIHTCAENKHGRTFWSMTFAWLFGEEKTWYIYLVSHFEIILALIPTQLQYEGAYSAWILR